MAMQSGSFVVMYGDPVGGFFIVGTFECADDAVDYASKNIDSTWWVMPVETPETDEER